MAAEVRIEGFRELNRALRFIDKNVAKEIRDEFREAAEPVRASAETLAVSRIRNIGPVWSRMRVGSTAREVYVAPRARRRGGSPRPNVGRLLFEQSMVPALEKHRGEIEKRTEDVLDRLGRKAGF